ncbi:MAG: zinc ABC transporter substrate-binding protein [Halofilum sp. (in: g-proteobacteria)]|nr:zinc ABC transporter substrate-binding protein [Halofilum sp. (in: g-proteobacteria)]
MTRALLLLLALLPVAASAATPRIVVTLAPLHALVTGVAGPAAEPHLLLRGAASPHAFSLAPSDARALARADLVVAADPNLEKFLERPLGSLAADAAVIWLTAIEDVHRLPARAGGQWEAHRDDTHDNHDHDHEHGHEPGQHNPHAWLDPLNAIAFTRTLAERLASLDPDNAGTYRANAARQVERLQALDRDLDRQVAPVRDVPYLVFHDAYHYFEDRYGLQPIGAVAVDPARPPGARRLAELHDRIERTGARCLFAEPQFEPKIVRVIHEATGIRTAVLDPLGAELEPGPDLYDQLMRNLADDLVECLGQ